MATPKYTIPDTAQFTVVVTNGHVRVDISEMSMNGAPNFTLSAYAAAVRAKMLVEFDAAIKIAAKSSDDVNVENVTDHVDYRTTFIGADGKPATMVLGFDTPADTGIMSWADRLRQYPGMAVSVLKDQERSELIAENAMLKAKLAALAPTSVTGGAPIISTTPGAPR